LTVQVAIQVSK